MVTLRIVFTILSALCLAALIPVGIFAGLTPALIVGVLALLFFGAMYVCKQAQLKTEQKDLPAKPDFITYQEPDSKDE